MIFSIGSIKDFFYSFLIIIRLLIIRTTNYNLEDIVKILAIRAATEGITLSQEALGYLGQVGNKTSLRYAV